MSEVFKKADKIAVFDADNTLWDWVGLKNKEVDAMISYFMGITDLSRQEVLRSISKVYQQQGTPDYSGLIQNMDIFQGLKRSHIVDLIRGCIDVCIQVRRTDLKLYEGVENLLQTLKTREDIATCVVSDAPMSELLTRSRHTDSYKYFDMLFGQPEKREEHVARVIESARGAKIPFQYLRSHKPNVFLGKSLGLSDGDVNKKVTIIGNSEKADLGMAVRNQCRCLLAGWGASPIEIADNVTQMVYAKPERVDMPLTEDLIKMIKAVDVHVLDKPSDVEKYFA